jgi:cytochrome c553
VLTDALILLAMPQIDLVLAAELLVVLLLVATMDAPSPRLKAAEPALEEPEPPVQWTAETDLACAHRFPAGGPAGHSCGQLSSDYRAETVAAAGAKCHGRDLNGHWRSRPRCGRP